MSEEEKKIIEITKNHFNSILDVGDKFMLGKIYQIIDKQQKEIEELKQITILYNSYEVPDERKIVIADSEYFVRGFFKENFIHKDKIREKIKKYEKLDKEEYAKQGNFETEISLLKELLEEK